MLFQRIIPNNCWLTCSASKMFYVILYLQSVYVFLLPHRHPKYTQKRGNLWLHFPVSYSTRSTCKDHYPQENPAALKSLCKLNHIQTSGAEFCCCAQGMKNSVGDVNWMFLEYHESRIIGGTQNAFPATFCSLQSVLVQ